MKKYKGFKKIGIGMLAGMLVFSGIGLPDSISTQKVYSAVPEVPSVNYTQQYSHLAAGKLYEPGYAGDGGVGTIAMLNDPAGVDIDSNGNIYIADSRNCVIRKIDATTKNISTIAGIEAPGLGGDGGLATAATISYPNDIVVDKNRNIYIADTGNNAIRKIDAVTKTISTVAGGNGPAYSGDHGPATAAHLNNPSGVDVDDSGNIYIADANNNVIRKVTATTGIITTIAGTGTGDYNGDGALAVNATLNFPLAVAVDATGNVYIADTGNNAIRKIDATTKNIATIAGPEYGYTGDGALATNSMIANPHDLAVDGTNNLYYIDRDNEIIRKIDATSKKISTVVGERRVVNEPTTGDELATKASIRIASGLGVNNSGEMVIAQGFCQIVTKVTTDTKTLTLDPIAVNTTTVTGTAGQNAEIKVTLTDGTTTTVTAGATGSWSATGLTASQLTSGLQVKAEVVDPTSRASVSAQAIRTVSGGAPTDTIAPNAPVIQPVDNDDLKISGTAETNSTVKITLPVNIVRTVATSATGTWSITINTPLEVNATISATATDAAGNESTQAIKIVLPSAPGSIKAVSSSYNSVKVSWAAVTDATGYEIYRATSTDGPYTKIGKISTLYLNSTSLTTGKYYCYKVRTYKTIGDQTIYSKESIVVKAVPVPSSPTGLKAVRASSTSIKLTWTKTAGATGYEIYKSSTSSGTYARVTATSATYFTNTKLIKGKTLYYKIKAYRTVSGKKVYGGFSVVKYAKPY